MCKRYIIPAHYFAFTVYKTKELALSSDTHFLQLPYIAANQAQKHVTHNEALVKLDALVQLSVISRQITTPMAAPQEPSRYIVPVASSQEWAGHDNKIALYQDNYWTFIEPQTGWICYVADEALAYVFDGTQWVALGGGALDLSQTDFLGINAVADANTRFLTAANKSVFSHEGTDHRLFINKAAQTDTASLVWQNDWSGRAELGLAGSDDFQLKLSNDGANWQVAMSVDPANGVPITPNRPFFRAAPTNVQAFTGWNTPLLFDTILESQGTNFSFQNGVFTAQIAGLYQFAATMRFDNIGTGGYVRCFFTRNHDYENLRLGQMLSGDGHSTDYMAFTLSATLKLNIGDEIRLAGGCSNGQGILHPESVWEGVFLG